MNSFNRIAYTYSLCNRENSLMRNTIGQMSSNKLQDLHITDEIDDINVVIILGESLRRNSMHCYGANVPNTPYIDSLVSSGDIILFKDVLTSGANTDLSVKQILTFYDNINNNKNKWYQYPTLFNALKQAGYYTYWLSNCESGGVYVNNINAISSTCDSLTFTGNVNTNDIGSDFAHKYDEYILPLMLRGTDLGKSKFATLIHLMGSHSSYENRYPKEFDKFISRNDISDKSQKNKMSTVMAYLNSVLYNDYIIKNIIDFYSDTPAIVFYFSDHGLDLFDNPKHPDGHGHETSPYSAPVPFMVYVSPEIRKRGGTYDDIVRRVENAKDKPISLDMFTNSLIDLLGINTEYKSNYTQFFRDDYIPPKRRALIGFSENVELFIDTIRTVPDNWNYEIRH